MRIKGFYDVVMASMCLYLYVCHYIVIDIYIYIFCVSNNGNDMDSDVGHLLYNVDVIVWLYVCCD